MVWREPYATRRLQGFVWPSDITTVGLEGEPDRLPVLIGCFCADKLTGALLWAKLMEADFGKRSYNLVVVAEGDASSTDLMHLLPPSKHSMTLLARDPGGHLATLLGGRGSFAIHLATGLAFSGQATEDAWEEFSDAIRADSG